MIFFPIFHCGNILMQIVIGSIYRPNISPILRDYEVFMYISLFVLLYLKTSALFCQFGWMNYWEYKTFGIFNWKFTCQLIRTFRQSNQLSTVNDLFKPVFATLVNWPFSTYIFSLDNQNDNLDRGGTLFLYCCFLIVASHIPYTMSQLYSS